MAVMARLQTETVEYPGEQVTLRAFVAAPHHAHARPAVVVLHEWWGLNEQIKGVATRFAQEGYVAIAPDLYARQGCAVTADPAQAGKLMTALSTQWALKDINAAIRQVKSRPDVDPLRIGVVGFSLGGSIALMMAAHNSDIQASVGFYGQVPPSDSLKYLVAPVLAIHAGKDTWATKAEALRLQQALAQFGRPGEVIVYDDADHAFFNETNAAAYRVDAATDAWNRTLAFLKQHLKPTAV